MFLEVCVLVRGLLRCVFYREAIGNSYLHGVGWFYRILQERYWVFQLRSVIFRRARNLSSRPIYGFLQFLASYYYYLGGVNRFLEAYSSLYIVLQGVGLFLMALRLLHAGFQLLEFSFLSPFVASRSQGGIQFQRVAVVLYVLFKARYVEVLFIIVPTSYLLCGLFSFFSRLGLSLALTFGYVYSYLG